MKSAVLVPELLDAITTEFVYNLLNEQCDRNNQILSTMHEFLFYA